MPDCPSCKIKQIKFRAKKAQFWQLKNVKGRIKFRNPKKN